MRRIDWRLALGLVVAVPVVFFLHHEQPRIVESQGGAVEGPAYPTKDADGDLPDGLRLLPGDGGRLPVTVRWSVPADRIGYASAIAYDDGTAYVVSSSVEAYDVRDGSSKWNTGPPGYDGLFDDGGVSVGTTEKDQLVAVAPWNYEIVLDRRSGTFQSMGLPYEHALRTPEITKDISEPADGWVLDGTAEPGVTAVRDPNGRVVWRMKADVPNIEGFGPIAIPGGLLVVADDGSVLALDYAP